MAATHNDTISITITLASAPLTAAGFGAVLLLVDLATNSLDGDRVVTYTSLASATADFDSSFISAGTLAAVTVAFAQRPQPTEFKVGNVDIVGAETYADGLAEVILVDPDFYGVVINSRADTDILTVAAAVELQTRKFLFQSSDADWLTTGGLPAALTALAGLEKTVGIWHDTATEWADVAWMVDRLAFDPDIESVTWNARPNNVAALATGLTQAQIDFADTNFMNLGLLFGRRGDPNAPTFWIDAGVSMSGRPIYEQSTADWFEVRLQEAVTFQKIAYADRGEKIVVGATGQAMLRSLIDSQFAIGETAKHFAPGETASTMPAITAADRTAQRIRGEGRAAFAVDGRVFVFTFDFGIEPLASA